MKTKKLYRTMPRTMTLRCGRSFCLPEPGEGVPGTKCFPGPRRLNLDHAMVLKPPERVVPWMPSRLQFDG